MLELYMDITDFFFSLERDDIPSRPSYPLDGIEVKSLLETLRDTDYVTKCLHRDYVTKAKTLVLLDESFVEYEGMRKTLWKLVPILAGCSFETAVVKIQEGLENILSAEENESVQVPLETGMEAHRK